MTDIIKNAINTIAITLNKDQVFVKTPIVLVLALFLIETGLWYLSIASSIGTSWDARFCIFLIGIIEIIIAMAALLAGIRHIANGRYKSALSLTVLFGALILVFVMPGILRHVDEIENAEYHHGYPYDLANFIKFTLHEKQYLELIKNAQPDENGHRYMSFVWAGAQGDGTELVYDESDVLSSTTPPMAFGWWRNVWKIKVAKENEERANVSAEEEVCRYNVYRIKGHFYVVRFTCGF